MRPWKLLLTAVVLTSLFAVTGCGPSAPPEEKAAQAEPETKAEAPPEAPKEEPKKEVETARLEPPKAPKVEPKPAPTKANPVVVMDTSLGTMKIELNAERAPITVKNFLQYVDDRFYDGTIFHRVMPNFMIQGGGFTSTMDEKKTRAPIRNEAANGLANLRGTLAMARTPDPHSASSQFFINHGSRNEFLNKDQNPDGWGYAVFGKVIEGMDVVDKIAAVQTGNKAGHADVPLKAVVIKSVRRAD